MATGTVQRFDTSRGLGSIKPDDASVDAFVRQGVLGRSSYVGLTARQLVDFEAQTGPKGRPARTVRSA